MKEQKELQAKREALKKAGKPADGGQSGESRTSIPCLNSNGSRNGSPS